MEHYALFPEDWDYDNHLDTIKELGKQGIYTVYDMPEVINKCGGLFPFITTKTGAIKYAKSVKKQFPYIKFNLCIGETWGETQLVQQF